MKLNNKIFSVFANDAEGSVIDEITIGIGYTAVTLTDGRCGLCATLCDPKHAFSLNTDRTDYEGRAAIQLLRKIKEGDNHLSRVMAVALVNALNQPFAKALPDGPNDLHKDFDLPKGAKIAMIGHFSPVFKQFEETGSEVRSLDLGRGIGKAKEFYPWATAEADVLILTGTSIVNQTMIEVLDKFSSRTLPVVVMGASTILREEIYEDLPIRYVAGSVVVVKKDLLKAVRNGRGTLDIHYQAKNVFLTLE
ncbi:MAG: DUF364 domain-containing protein [Sphaerochaetaceae bacterium]|jgi:uncharacterized protein (DUF4213/DUF364 family)|nr:DUF364 domain-containing protein [Sphaerochaetaceae bacterium]MDY0371376.1 DUF364 domain-containing protein [Sphaerochaetaceae bacterium]